MKEIVIMNSKGGVGKTTLADELVFWVDRHTDPEDGQVWQIADLDAQGGLIHEPGERAGALVEIVDMPGEIGERDADVVRQADVVVVPMHNSSRDRPATEQTLRTIKRAGRRGLPVVLVVNRYVSRTRQDREWVEQGLRDWLNGLIAERSLPMVVCVMAMPESSLVRAAAEEGVSVVTKAPRSSAAKAVDEVCEAVWDAMMNPGYEEYVKVRTEKRGPWTLLMRKDGKHA
jgi:chromosome partitioning protein